MSLSLSDLLSPISEENPAGLDMRYAPVTAEIREARRHEEELNQGVWAHTVKSADYPRVIKLCTEALKSQGKDLQLVAWLTEALLARDGFPGLLAGLNLIRSLLDTFWNSVYPLPDKEDGDLSLRSTSIEWVSTQLDIPIKSVGLNAAGHNWIQYTDSRTIPTEADANTRPERGQVRTDALQSGRLAPEEFEREFSATPRKFYEDLNSQLEELLSFVLELSADCDQRFAGNAPDFGPLSGSLTDVHRTLHVLLVTKRESEPDPDPVPEATPVVEDSAIAVPEALGVATPPLAAAPIRTSPTPLMQQVSAMPGTSTNFTDAAVAIQAIIRASHFLRGENPDNPAPYLALRALRWSDLRDSQSSGASSAPPVETRMELKRLSSECDWTSLIEAAEKAFAEPFGAQWLDLQRYTIVGLQSNGNDIAAGAIINFFKSILVEFPDLPDRLLADDTPAASRETQEWLRSQRLLKPEPIVAESKPAVMVSAPPPIFQAVSLAASEKASDEADSPHKPDPFETALAYAQSGQIHDGLEILSEALARETVGRKRFIRRIQLAKICLTASEDALAMPFLEDLAASIAHHDLSNWEAPNQVSEPLAMLYRCRSKLAIGAAESAELFAQICRINPVEAFDLKPWHANQAHE